MAIHKNKSDGRDDSDVVLGAKKCSRFKWSLQFIDQQRMYITGYAGQLSIDCTYTLLFRKLVNVNKLWSERDDLIDEIHTHFALF